MELRERLRLHWEEDEAVIIGVVEWSLDCRGLMIVSNAVRRETVQYSRCQGCEKKERKELPAQQEEHLRK
jgi:hypothetical protein